MKREIAILLVIGLALVGMAGAANYMYEKTGIEGVGFMNSEKIVQTQVGLAGNKLVEKTSGSGNVNTYNTEMEVQRPGIADADGCVDEISYTKAVELEYMPISYQTGTYDQKWIDKLCVQNYYIGATAVEMYTQAEHLQKNTEIKTRKQEAADEEGEDGNTATNGGCGECTGALEANFNANVIGVAHLGWLSKDVNVDSKGRHPEYGRSVEDLTGVFSIEKFIQIWGNDTCGAVSVDWLPCI
ncbi:MAG: hypothetical protein J5I35_10455 [Methanothrix harundinacea]|nr:hypothetical protein [Methanothrix harundinacea]